MMLHPRRAEILFLFLSFTLLSSSVAFGAPASEDQQLLDQIRAQVTEGEKTLARAGKMRVRRRNTRQQERRLKVLLKAAAALSMGYRTLTVSRLQDLDSELMGRLNRSLDALQAYEEFKAHQVKLEGRLFEELQKRNIGEINKQIELLMQLDPRLPELKYALQLIQERIPTPEGEMR